VSSGVTKEITDEKREALYREALSVHPDLMIAANNLASLLIKQNRADTTLLKPFITQDAPSAILVNQTVSYLQKRDFKKANHFAGLLPDNKETEMVKALAAAMDGKYQEAYPTFEKQGGNQSGHPTAEHEAKPKSLGNPEKHRRYFSRDRICQSNRCKQVGQHRRSCYSPEERHRPKTVFKRNCFKRWRRIRFTGFIRYR
jgi:hypothetical protein